MLEFLKKVARSQAFKEVLRVLVALAAGYTASGCGLIAGHAPNQAKLDVYECQLAVLAAVVPPAVAEDLVMAARAGNGSYVVKQLLSLGLTPEAVTAAADAFQACEPAEPAPAPAESAPPELLRTSL